MRFHFGLFAGVVMTFSGNLAVADVSRVEATAHLAIEEAEAELAELKADLLEVDELLLQAYQELESNQSAGNAARYSSLGMVLAATVAYTATAIPGMSWPQTQFLSALGAAAQTASSALSFVSMYQRQEISADVLTQLLGPQIDELKRMESEVDTVAGYKLLVETRSQMEEMALALESGRADQKREVLARRSAAIAQGLSSALVLAVTIPRHSQRSERLSILGIGVSTAANIGSIKAQMDHNDFTAILEQIELTRAQIKKLIERI